MQTIQKLIIIKNTTKMKDKRFKIKNKNWFILLLVMLAIFTSCLFFIEKMYLFIKGIFKKNQK